MKSKLIEKQEKTFLRTYRENGDLHTIEAIIRYDDRCKNGHNTFSITGMIYRIHRGWKERSVGGCIHEEIAKWFPELKPLIKWHLCSSDGPTHYIANTVYLAGDKDCWGKKGKERELRAARRVAIWPDATDKELCLEPQELKKALENRLPGLLEEFRKAIEELGFEF